MVCLCAALSLPAFHLVCKQRKLLARQKSQCHPAKEVVHDRLRISKFLIAGPARGFEPSMRELVAEYLERHAMLHAHLDDSGETLHQCRFAAGGPGRSSCCAISLLGTALSSSDIESSFLGEQCACRAKFL